ncbi:MAG TPA: hypothetical protein DCR21_02775 [Succinivibrionaceae bacterium]|nr:hypothetical protein [Succinivibrionaceae bacterium]
MKSVFKYSTVAVVTLAVLWAGGTALSGYRSQQAMDAFLDNVNSLLAQKKATKVSSKDIKAHYERTQSSFFSESGNIVIEETGERKISLPVNICHGFLKIDADIDFYHYLKSSLINGGVLSSTSSSRGKLSLSLIPFGFNFEGSIKGDYAPGYGKQNDRLSMGENYKTLNVSFNLHQGMIGGLEGVFEARNVNTPLFRAGRVYAVSFSDKGDNSFGSIELGADELDAAGTMFEDIHDMRYEFFPENYDLKQDFYVGYNAELNSKKGVLKAHGNIGRLSSSELKQAGMQMFDLVSLPLTVNRYFTDSFGTLGLDSLKFDADYQGYEGHIVYTVDADGSISLPKGENLFNTLGRINGSFDVSFKEVNDTGKKVLESIGTNFLKKTEDGFSTKAEIRNGRIYLNGLEM